MDDPVVSLLEMYILGHIHYRPYALEGESRNFSIHLQVRQCPT